jgi:sporulation protein YqfC
MAGKGTRRSAAEAAAEINVNLNRLSGMMGIPPTALPGIPQIELGGNREAVIDGCQGILEYSEEMIKLAAGRMTLQFCGRGLQIKVLTHDGAVIEGFITSLEFLS